VNAEHTRRATFDRKSRAADRAASYIGDGVSPLPDDEESEPRTTSVQRRLDRDAPIDTTTASSAVRTAEGLAPGTIVGRYRLEELCGRGGFAAVYRARDAAGEMVAVKVVHPMLGGSHEVLERFHREALILNRLRSPHIVQVLDVDELEPGRPYFAMEWLSGATLAATGRARGRLSLPEAFAVLSGLGDALGLAHREGIVHRDVKAENVMVPGDGDLSRVVLLDFGIAKLLEKEGTPGATRTGSLLGTPGYMAPEQIRGFRVDERVDIYALGVLFFELVTGQMPFTGRVNAEVEERALREPVPRISERAAVPVALDAIVARCLAKDPADRYASAQELLDALWPIADGAARARPAAEPDAHALTAGLYVGLVAEHAMSDDELDAADAALDEIAAFAEAAGLEQAVRGATSHVFARPLSSPADCAELRSFARARREALTPDLARRFRFVLHVAPRQPSGPGSALLVLGSWAVDASEPGLFETTAFAARVAPAS
jgi:eukaryotic-like serine/threonine-protein kinase